MTPWMRSRTRLFLALLLAAGVLSATAGPAGAVECTRISLSGEERECTDSEKFKQCWENTIDAYLQCIGSAPEDDAAFWEELSYQMDLIVCQGWAGVDQIGCSVDLPLDKLF